jgi:hypothetical protein
MVADGFSIKTACGVINIAESHPDDGTITIRCDSP